MSDRSEPIDLPILIRTLKAEYEASDGTLTAFVARSNLQKAIAALEAAHRHKTALEAIVYDDYHDNITVAKIMAKQALLPAAPIVEQGEK